MTDIILEVRPGGYLSVDSEYVAKNLDKIKKDKEWQRFKAQFKRAGVDI